MESRILGRTWKETAANIMDELTALGCRYDRKLLPEIAMGYECTPLFFWNWLEDAEAPATERSFLKALGYAWRRHLQEDPEEESETARAENRGDMAA